MLQERTCAFLFSRGLQPACLPSPASNPTTAPQTGLCGALPAPLSYLHSPRLYTRDPPLSYILPLVQVLDVATASGEPALMLASALPQAHVVATDIAEEFMAPGRARAEQVLLGLVLSGRGSAGLKRSAPGRLCSNLTVGQQLVRLVSACRRAIGGRKSASARRALQAGLKDRVSFRVADAQDLGQFADGSFDAVTCCLGG